jgi:hypothetical protein
MCFNAVDMSISSPPNRRADANAASFADRAVAIAQEKRLNLPVGKNAASGNQPFGRGHIRPSTARRVAP